MTPLARGASRRSVALGLCLGLACGCFGCDDGVSMPAAPGSPADAPPPDVVADRLLHGSAEVCGTDRDCAAQGPTPVCALGGCLGILSADSRAAVEILVGRASAAAPPVRERIQAELRRRLAPGDADAPGSPLARAHALTALAALAEVDRAGQGAAAADPRDVALLRAQLGDRYPFVAAQARLGLARLGLADGLRTLLDDVRDGTEPLRVEALGAIAALARAAETAPADRKKIRAALVAATTASSWAVRSAAGRSLATLPRTADSDAALQALAARDDGALAYALSGEE
jgi:hypothetical protein